jgi:hypothetical protein
MYVYRFERNGIGPYINRSSAYRITHKRKRFRQVQKYIALQADYQRGLTEEQYDNYQKAHSHKKYMFACSSKEQLKRYFFGDFKVLFSEGFRIKRYKVPDNEIIDMGGEVAFPVRYHKLQSVPKIKRVRKALTPSR